MGGNPQTALKSRLCRCWLLLARSPSVLNPPISAELQSHGYGSNQTMQSMLSVGNPDDTRILYIKFSHTDPELAAQIANAYAKAAKKFIINTMRGEEPSDFSIALQPSVGYAISRTKYMAMGFLGGSALAIALLVVLFLLDKGPRSPEAIQTYGGIPTLAIFPHREKEKFRKPSAADKESFLSEGGGGGSPRLMISNFPAPDYASMEAMNTLCTNLSYCGSGIRKIMITSRYASEGKSYISMNLMRTLCSLGRRVVLVDADLRASGIQADYHLHYQTKERNGLSEYLSGRCDISDVLYQTNVSGTWMMAAFPLRNCYIMLKGIARRCYRMVFPKPQKGGDGK